MTAPKDSRIQLRNRTVATILAILVPGLGHFYQRRIFKGCIYMICILGTFFFGISLGEGRTVYMRYYQKSRDHNINTKYWNIGYGSQILVGLASAPAIFQHERYEQQGPIDINDHLSEKPVPFDGYFICKNPDGLSVQIPTSGKLSSRVEMQPTDFQGMSQKVIIFSYEGQANFPGENQPRNFSLNSMNTLDNDLEPRIYARPRYFYSFGLNQHVDNGYSIFRMSGEGEYRPLSNWYQVPPTDEVINDLNGRLGKYWELAMVFTWIAGLLNVLAIWDAAEGPAYEYGDKPVDRSGNKPPEKIPDPEPVTVSNTPEKSVLPDKK